VKLLLEEIQMASMKEHLTQFHESEAAHHDHKAAHHKAIAGHYHKLASSLGKAEVTEAQADSKATLEAMAGMHEVTSQNHADRAEYHRDCAEKCRKAMNAADLNKLVPTSVSAIAPDRPNIRAVLRPGQREFPANTAPELSKIIGVGDEFMHSEEQSVR
jgi:hypothetical protein